MLTGLAHMIHRDEEFHLVLTVERAALDVLGDVSRRFCVASGLDDLCEKRLHLVLEELVTNTVDYGKCEQSPLDLRLQCVSGAVLIDYTDHGIAFDPTHDAPDDGRNLSLEERPVGGLGWTLVHTLCPQIEYTRETDANHLRLWLAID